MNYLETNLEQDVKTEDSDKNQEITDEKFKARFPCLEFTKEMSEDLSQG